MRRELAKEEGKRKKFRATFVRLGKKINYKGYAEETVLLKSIIDAESNAKVAEHLWFSYTRNFEKITLEEGAVVEFEARIRAYTKGYINKRYKIDRSSKDYKLSHPTKIKVIAAGAD